MREFDLHATKIRIGRGSPAPVLTAAHRLAVWLNLKIGVNLPVEETGEPAGEGAAIIVGILDQHYVDGLVKEHNLPSFIRHDGYALACFGDKLLVYSVIPRGVVYACGYEIPRRASFDGSRLNWPVELVVEEPEDDIRAFCFWGYDHSAIPNLAGKYRLNTLWLGTKPNEEVFLPDEPALRSYIAPYEEEIRKQRTHTEDSISVAMAHGMEAFIGCLGAVWHFPSYLYDAIIQVYPDMLAKGYKGATDWPPYEWQDRPIFCPSSPIARRLYASAIEEFLTAHPEAAGLATGPGYDGYPLACGCERCQDYSYNDRFRDMFTIAYDVAVRKLHKKLWIWSWITGGSSGVPGYECYYNWLQDFAIANPETVMVTSFGVEGDFNITHPLNPVIGQRGSRDFASVLLWPEYRGEGIVPGCLIDWMAASFPALRAKGARGFVATDTIPHKRELDILQGQAELYAYGELTWNGKSTGEQVASAYCADKFGPRAGGIIQAALRKSWDVIVKAMYFPGGGPRFIGHSHIENDLRMMWEIYTLSDSAPFFLTERQRKEITQTGRPYEPNLERALPRLAFTEENIQAVLRAKDEAIAEAEWTVAQVDLARPFLEPGVYEHLHARFNWLLNYTRLFKGYVRAFMHLRRGGQADGAEIIKGAQEMADAVALLPEFPKPGEPMPYDVYPQFYTYPWLIAPPWELINALKAVGKILASGIRQRPIGVLGCEEAVAAFNSIYLPFTRLREVKGGLAQCSAVVIGASAMFDLEEHGEEVADYVQNGGRVLLYNPTENWEALPTKWLPGKVLSWVCNHPKVRVTAPDHPVVKDYKELKAEPILRFNATSAAVNEANCFSPFIKSSIAVSNDWETLTYPAVLAETNWGEGRILINLLPENRTILLRALAYLAV